MLFLIYCMVCFKFASHWTQQEPHKHHCIHQNDPALTKHRSNMFDHVWSCLLQNCFKHISKYFQNHFKIISNTFLNLFNIIFLSLSFWHFLAHSSSFNSPHCPLWPAKVLANQVGTDRSAKYTSEGCWRTHQGRVAAETGLALHCWLSCFSGDVDYKHETW